MDPAFEALLRSWPLDPWIVCPLLVTGAIYVRGWRRLRQRGVRWHGPGPLTAFLGGLAALVLALASPIEPFAYLLLQVHMVQHLLLMMVAPPLLWLGAPLLPLLHGLPAPIRQNCLVPLLRLPELRWLGDRLTRPLIAWLLYVAASWFWHVPRFYDLALRSDNWHYLEHACFVLTALLFWYPVVQPHPARVAWSRWLLLPYLLLADIQNTILSALLTFSDRVLYPHYAAVPRLWDMTPLEDQAAAGVLMWVPGSLAFLIPLAWIGVRLLQGYDGKRPAAPSNRRIALPLVRDLIRGAGESPASRGHAASSRWDLLRVPAFGRFLRWRHARIALQIPLLLLAALILWDGFTGPRIAPMNLAGVLPWIHWRGLVVLGLLVAGNLFCMACPFMLPRALAKRWLPAQRTWPRWLRGKWLALALLVAFFLAYEAFSLWDSPWLTAWIALSYFIAAFVIDGWFRGAAFCKYVCPIGQFNFVQSLVSPLQITVRDRTACLDCAGKECIRGVQGCELHLFLPRKVGNLDCTFCLDCVHACPHDNVGITASVPGADLLHDPHRSGVGRFSKRPDLAALVVVLVFAAYVHAAAMVGPVVALEDRLATALHLKSPFMIVASLFAFALLVVPLLLIGTATTLGRWWSGESASWRETATRFSFSLVPLGFAMWLTHYSFHFLTSGGTAVPALQRFTAELGVSLLGKPEWGWGCCLTVASWLLRLEILFLDLGLLASLYIGYRIALTRFPIMIQAIKAFAPWGVLMLLLFATGIWIVFQPMEMRGTLTLAD